MCMMNVLLVVVNTTSIRSSFDAYAYDGVNVFGVIMCIVYLCVFLIMYMFLLNFLLMFYVMMFLVFELTTSSSRVFRASSFGVSLFLF